MGGFVAFSQLCSGLGLSSAAGLNAYVPLLAIGILGRMGIVHLDGPYALLSTWTALIVLGVLAVIDFVGDKVPAVDHAMHAVGVVVAPVAGAIVFGSQTHAIGNVPAALSLAAGLVVAGGFHATRAAVRPVSTAATGGIANPILSLIEDATAVVLSILAVFIPVLAVVFLLILVFMLYRSWGAVRSFLARKFGSKPNQAATTSV
jgi:hypothetical protein